MSDAKRSAMTDCSSPPAVRASLERVGYFADDALATVVFLGLSMDRPLFLEGEPGSGKTELAKAISAITEGELIRLQCYEGIDVAQALYEWDYARQLIHLRVVQHDRGAREVDEQELFSDRFLLKRPLLRALSANRSAPRPVLLIDEVDRADDEFEAFLLEALSEYAVTIPEVGTVRAIVPPIVVLTSNRTRDVHDALKRRSLYHWMEAPSLEQEVSIVRARAPKVTEALADTVSRAVRALREIGLYKPPGVAETIDWAVALETLGYADLDVHGVDATLGIVLKYREDVDRVREFGVETLVARARS